MTAGETLEGYAALFGVVDLEGDVVRAGAFADAARRAQALPMLVAHDRRLCAGAWTHVQEDARGLIVKGAIDAAAPGAAAARALLARGCDGLSIGFRTRAARRLGARGRELLSVELLEISLAPHPMQPLARLFKGAPFFANRKANA